MVRRFLSATVVLLVGMCTVVFTAGSAHADEARNGQWYLDALGINEAHKLSQGKGVTIGVIDSGIDAEHPDLKGNVKPGKGYGDGAAEDGLQDDRNHGTGVASVLAGHGHGQSGSEGVLGVAPAAKIVSVGINWEDQGDAPEVANHVNDAIKWLVDKKVDLISASIGAPGGDNSGIEYATEHGVPIVAAAGNVSAESDELTPGKYSTLWPARATGVIPVTGATEKGEFWDGSLTLEAASSQPEYGVSAPAENLSIALPGGEYGVDGGTSLATPVVAGTLALVKSAYPDLDLQTWIVRMLETVNDVADDGYDTEFGHGIVNPLRALTEDVKVDDAGGVIESDADDRLPLREQGKQDGAAGSAGASGAGEGSDFVLTLASVAGAVLVLLALITVPVLQSRRDP